MEVLMLRLDIFDKLHRELHIFWREVSKNIVNNNIVYFGYDIANSAYAERSLPELFILCKERIDKSSLLEDMDLLQRNITADLKGQMVKTDGTHDLIVHRPLTEEEEISKDEFYEINESKRVLNQEIKKLDIIVKKEMQKFWNHIDILTIDSYKQMLFNITGSDDFVHSFMKELLKYGIMKDLDTAKRNHDYETIAEISGVMNDCIGDWVVDIEQLVGAPQ